MFASISTRMLALSLVAVTCACGEATPPRATEPTSPAAAASAPAATEAPSAPAADTAAAPKRRGTFDIKSLCDAPVPLFYGESPEKGEGTRFTVDPHAVLPTTRIAEEKSHLWLVDPAGKPLAHVRVSRGMKTVEIGSSCRTLTSQ